MSESYLELYDYISAAAGFHINLIRGNNQKAFTRMRKVSAQDLIYQMLTRRGRTQWSELMDFYDVKKSDKRISETGFYLARKKFNPEAIRVMCNEFTANSYDNHDEYFEKIKGCYLLSIDGSKIIVPNTEENVSVFGKLRNEENQPAMALVSTLHDCLNALKLDILVDQATGNEKNLASQHIDYFCANYIGKAIFTMDRGYPSIRLIDQIIAKNQFFLMRISSEYLKEYSSDMIVGDDKVVDVTFDRIKTNHYRKDIRFRQKLMNTIYKLRFTKIKIGENDDGSDKTEILLSNLPMDKFDTQELKELYHKRWTIETSYNQLKNRMKLEEFSGYKADLVLQDIYADVWCYNVVALNILEANYKRPIEQLNGKYTVKRNFNKSLGIVKRLLLKLLVYHDDIELRKKYQEQLADNIDSNLVWVENNRTVSRKTALNKSEISYRKTY